MTKILSKFGEQQLVMVNYACGFNQSETGKYFEWIIINITALYRLNKLTWCQVERSYYNVTSLKFMYCITGPKNASTNFIWCAISKRLVTVFYGPKGKGAAITELKSGKKSRCTVLFPFFSVILQVTSHDALGRTLLSEIANFET